MLVCWQTVSMAAWNTGAYQPTDQSKREKLEFIFVVLVQGMKGPHSDERHLLNFKLNCKFYLPEFNNFLKQGCPLGAIKLGCAMGQVSKITSVQCFSVEKSEILQVDSEDKEGLSEDPDS